MRALRPVRLNLRHSRSSSPLPAAPGVGVGSTLLNQLLRRSLLTTYCRRRDDEEASRQAAALIPAGGDTWSAAPVLMPPLYVPLNG